MSRSISLMLFSSITLAVSQQPCVPQHFSSNSFVCVCNSTYCDSADPVVPLPRGQALHVTSDRQQHRFTTTTTIFAPSSFKSDTRSTFGLLPKSGNLTLKLKVEKEKTFQTILGFGGSFTDATGINIAKLSEASQDLLLKAYFDGNSGLDYSLARVNMGGCDFSTRLYTYADTPGDVSLGTFALQEEDIVYKIPYILKAQALREEPIKLFGSPWTAPPWMKSNNDFIGDGFLLPEYYQVYADYFVRFLQEYESSGVTFWGLTTQNEPTDGNIPDFPFTSMGWNSSTQTVFITRNLGPALHSAGYEDVKVMILDDQRVLAPNWASEVFSDPLASLYASGVAVHWYLDETLGLPHALDSLVHEQFPDKFILYTEAAHGYLNPQEDAVILGSWERGEKYLGNIIEDLNHWVVGWTDWNLALDMEGGPNWANETADAPVIVNAKEDIFFKQPMYYALGHVSRFMTPGSVRIGLEDTEEEMQLLEYVAVKRPDGGVAIVLMNRDTEMTISVSIFDEELGYLDLDLGPSSIHSVVYWQ